MRRYEMALVAAPSLSEEEHDQQITVFEQLIAERGGTVHKVDRWGRRKLAYPIRRFTEGNFTFVLFDAEPELEKEILRRLRLSDVFLRFLSVRADEQRPPTAEEQEALVQNRQEILRRAAERAAQEEEADKAEGGEEERSDEDDDEDERRDDDERRDESDEEDER